MPTAHSSLLATRSAALERAKHNWNSRLWHLERPSALERALAHLNARIAAICESNKHAYAVVAL